MNAFDLRQPRTLADLGVIPQSLTTASTVAGATSYTTGVIKPKFGTLILAAIMSRRAAGSGATPTASGYSQIGTANNIFFSNFVLTLFQKFVMVESGGETITFDFAGQTQSGAAWSVVQFDNTDNWDRLPPPVVQNATNKDDSGSPGASLTVTLSAKPRDAARNATFAAFAVDGTPTITPPPGFFSLDIQTVTGRLMTMFAPWGATSVTPTFSSAVHSMGIVVELQAEPVRGISALQRLRRHGRAA